MNRTLHYLFDPLCGWCYGANSLLPAYLDANNLTLHLMPTGLFSDQGARPMTPDFARYAWENDQKIALMTGQVFSEHYRQRVLGNVDQAFNSGPATLALTAVNMTEPLREYTALNAIQHGRYVEGRDITQPEVLGDILRTCGLEQAQRLLLSADETLIIETALRIRQGLEQLQAVNARGVPTFILEDLSGFRVIPTREIYAQ